VWFLQVPSRQEQLTPSVCRTLPMPRFGTNMRQSTVFLRPGVIPQVSRDQFSVPGADG